MESDLDCDVACDDYYFEKRSKKRRTQFKTGTNSWNIDKARLNKLVKLPLLKLPQSSVDILSKLIINYQLKEITKVMRITDHTVSLHGKVSLLNQNFKELESDDVIIKIFTRKNHSKPDIEAAKDFNPRVYSKDRNKGKLPHIGYFWNNDHIDSDDLLINRIDNVVMVGYYKPVQKLIKRVQENPHETRDYYKQLIKLVYGFKSRDLWFWNERASLHDILWHRNEWIIVAQKAPIFRSYKIKEKVFAQNLISLFSLFQHNGLTLGELKSEFFRVFKHNVFYSYGCKLYDQEMLDNYFNQLK